MERAEFLSGLVWRTEGRTMTYTGRTIKRWVHIKEECKRGRERQGDHGERNGMEEERQRERKKERGGGDERRIYERGRKEEDYEEGMRWCT